MIKNPDGSTIAPCLDDPGTFTALTPQKRCLRDETGKVQRFKSEDDAQEALRRWTSLNNLLAAVKHEQPTPA